MQKVRPHLLQVENGKQARGVGLKSNLRSAKACDVLASKVTDVNLPHGVGERTVRREKTAGVGAVTDVTFSLFPSWEI